MLTMPRLVASLTANFDAWIVGSAADPETVTPRDWDVLVPYSQWGPASQVVAAVARNSWIRSNSFGGWKIKTADKEYVDVWPGELGWLMQNARASWAWHPKSGVRLTRYKEFPCPSKPKPSR